LLFGNLALMIIADLLLLSLLLAGGVGDGCCRLACRLV